MITLRLRKEDMFVGGWQENGGSGGEAFDMSGDWFCGLTRVHIFFMRTRKGGLDLPSQSHPNITTFFAPI